MPIFTANPLQRGHGVGGFLRGLMGLFSPILRLFSRAPIAKSLATLRKVAKNPIVKRGLSRAKKEFGRSALNVLSDVAEGKNMKQSVKDNGKQSIKKVGAAVLNDLRGGKKKKSSESSKKRKRTIFDN